MRTAVRGNKSLGPGFRADGLPAPARPDRASPEAKPDEAPGPNPAGHKGMLAESEPECTPSFASGRNSAFLTGHGR
ncbi:hypothetical protein GCM10022244_58300 [Streptomyces gulbargensis]|uniref:Uncharacterized protein n=1 Tax=Streptomyces gulbargensis TaxID=364901 RepID=A0ABP7ND90_9ACTN